MMPVTSGIELLRRLRREELTKDLLVIMLTAKEEMEEVFKLEGAKGYLVKPVEPASLIRKIQECLNPDE